MYIPINTSIKIKVTDQRHNIQLFTIIHSYQYRIFFSIFHLSSDLKDKSPISPTMLTYMTTIDKHIRNVIHSFETNKKTFSFPFGTNK